MHYLHRLPSPQEELGEVWSYPHLNKQTRKNQKNGKRRKGQERQKKRVRESVQRKVRNETVGTDDADYGPRTNGKREIFE